MKENSILLFSSQQDSAAILFSMEFEKDDGDNCFAFRLPVSLVTVSLLLRAPLVSETRIVRVSLDYYYYH